MGAQFYVLFCAPGVSDSITESVAPAHVCGSYCALNTFHWFLLDEETYLCLTCLLNSHNTRAIAFSIPPAIKRIKLHIFSAIITEVTLVGYATYIPAD